MLSENSLNLAIYPTDWAAENFAVDFAGIVRLVDLENIVLVNQTMLAMDKPPGKLLLIIVWIGPNQTSSRTLKYQELLLFCSVFNF